MTSSSCKGPPSKQARLSKSLAVASGQQVFRLQQLAAGGLGSTKPSGAFRRKVQKILEAPRQCFVQLRADTAEGDPIYYWVADVARLLTYVVDNSPSYKKCFLRAGSELSIILNADEATAGNTLATSPSKKAMLFYVAIAEVGHLKSVETWLPFGMITHNDLSQVDGGFSAVCAQVARHMYPMLNKALNIAGQQVVLSLKAFIGDYEGVCRLLSAKGAAALKPCCLCMNCVSSASEVGKIDNHFATIATPKLSAFHVHTTAELSATYESLLQEGRDLPRGEFDEMERQFGFILHPKSVLCCPIARSVLGVEKIIIDPLHCYWANGIAAQELLLLVTCLEERYGITLDALASSVSGVSWRCSSKQFSSPSSRKFLFHKPLWQGNFYRESAETHGPRETHKTTWRKTATTFGSRKGPHTRT